MQGIPMAANCEVFTWFQQILWASNLPMRDLNIDLSFINGIKRKNGRETPFLRVFSNLNCLKTFKHILKWRFGEFLLFFK